MDEEHEDLYAEHLAGDEILDSEECEGCTGCMSCLGMSNSDF